VNIIVCVKQVIDPEAPPTSFKIDSVNNTVTLPPHLPPVIDPYAEYAVEAALRIKDELGAKVTAISLGNDLLRDVMRKPLAMGADELILLEDTAFSGGDSWSTARALASAIEKLGDYDLIMCGRQASDTDAGQVGLGIAEILGLPSITVARKVQISKDKLSVERVTESGHEVIESSLPAVVTVSSELGEARFPSIKGLMTSKKKEPLIWKPADIGLTPEELGKAGSRARMVELFQSAREVECEIVDGETPEEAGANLAQLLWEAKII
jgi:electron transfer flavoprotein beta subunit